MQSPIKKLLLWFMAFVLVMACIPAAATPVPTLDPNTISTFIAQTANAASTRTASVPTLTATATLRSTATLEPTFTPVGAIIFPTLAPITRLQYYRVKHDNQLAYYNYKSRTADLDWPIEKWGFQTPEVVPMLVALKMGSGTHRTKLDSAWGSYIDKLNNYNEKKIYYVKADNTALFNGAGFPQLESLTMGGNIITLDEVRDGWGRVHTFDFHNPGPLEDVNYITKPDLIHKFVVVAWKRPTQTTFWVNPPPPYGDLYWPLVSSRAVWISMGFLEPFPILPMTVTGITTQTARSKPSKDSSLTNFRLSEGKSASVVEYYPSGSDVWGRLAGGGWIALLTHEKGVLQYPTSWSMETRPPLPPYK